LSFDKISIGKEDIKINVKITTSQFMFSRGMRKHFKHFSRLKKHNITL